MTIRRFTSREEWLAARKNSIGGSDLPALYGFGKRSALAVQLEKLGELPEFEPSRRYRVGLILEPLVADAARQDPKLAGYVIQEPTPNVIEMVVNEEVDHAHASPDRFIERSKVVSAGSTVGVLSLKTWANEDKASWEERPPTYALLQLQHEMMVCQPLGVETGYVTVLFGLGDEDRTFGPYEPNLKLHERIRNEIPVWWRRHITERRPVQAGQNDADLLKTLYPKSKPLSWMILTGPDWTRKFEEMEAAKAAAKAFDQDASALENEFKQAMGTVEIAVLGERAVRWKSSERKAYTVEAGTVRRFDSGKIPKEIQNAITRGESPPGDSQALPMGRELGHDGEFTLREPAASTATGGADEPKGSALGMAAPDSDLG